MEKFVEMYWPTLEKQKKSKVAIQVETLDSCVSNTYFIVDFRWSYLFTQFHCAHNALFHMSRSKPTLFLLLFLMQVLPRFPFSTYKTLSFRLSCHWTGVIFLVRNSFSCVEDIKMFMVESDNS